MIAASGSATPEGYAQRGSLPGGFERWEREPTAAALHAELALLLTTSGSTGDP